MPILGPELLRTLSAIKMILMSDNEFSIPCLIVFHFYHFLL